MTTDRRQWDIGQLHRATRRLTVLGDYPRREADRGYVTAYLEACAGAEIGVTDKTGIERGTAQGGNDGN